MKITGAAENPGGNLPTILEMADIPAMNDLLRCVSSEVGPILKASSSFGYGGAAGGGYSGHSMIYDLDGLFQELYDNPSMNPGMNDSLFGGGKGSTLASTSISSLAEAVERAVAALLSSSPLIPSQRVMGSYTDLIRSGHPALPPSSIALFSEEQYIEPHFLYDRFLEDTAVEWFQGTRIISGAPVWVPSQLVDMVHIYREGEALIGYPVSGGLSCHTSTMEATLPRADRSSRKRRY